MTFRPDLTEEPIRIEIDNVMLPNVESIKF